MKQDIKGCFCDIEKKGKAESLLDFKIVDKKLVISASCKRKKEYSCLALKYNHILEEDKIIYMLPTKKERDKKNVILSTEIDLDEIPFKMRTWQILAVYEEENKKYGVALKAPNTEKDIYKRFIDDYYCILGELIVFPHYSPKGIISLLCRYKNEYDDAKIHNLEKSVYKNYKWKKHILERKNIVLLYEKKCWGAQDNAYYFFKYCMENSVNENGNLKFFYVIDKRSPAYERVEKYDKYVIDFMSRKHMEYLLASKFVVTSESRNHIYAWQAKNSIFESCIREKKHVFLGHGIISFKRPSVTFDAKHMNSCLVTVSSEREKRIFTDILGYNKDDVKITGYARFDVLKDKSKEYNEILLMPTFRKENQGVEEAVVLKSQFYKKYMELLNSKKLGKFLDRTNTTLNFYLHPSIKEYINLFSSNNEKVNIIKYGEIALDELMMRCKLLITDYSSVTWDVLYMKKPILFYQYDREEYQKNVGCLIDLEKELPGDNATNLEELITNLSSVINNDYRLSDKTEENFRCFYKYLDQNNCERILEEVMKI